MSTKAMIAVLAVALALAGVTFFAVRPRGSPLADAPIAWLASLAGGESEIASIRVDWAKGDGSELRRREPTGAWVLSGSGGASWPVGTAQLRGALRLLAEQARGAREDAPGFVPDGPVVSVTTRAGAVGRIELSKATLGGKTPARVQDDRGTSVLMFDAKVRDLFTREGLLAWRKKDLYAGETWDPERVIIEAGGVKLAASSVGGWWGLSDPVAAPASKEGIAALLARLRGLQMARAVDDAPADVREWFEAPVLTLGTETVLHRIEDGRVSRLILVESLTVGKGADVAQSTRFVRARAVVLDPATRKDLAVWGPIVGVIEVGKLEGLALDPRALVQRRSVRAAGADVSGVRISPASSFEAPPPGVAKGGALFSRRLEGWSREGGTSDLKDSDKVGGLVRSLADVDATAVEFEVPAGARAIAVIAVSGGTFQEERLVLGVAGEGRKLVVRNGGVWRVYDQPWVGGLVEWVESIAGSR